MKDWKDSLAALAALTNNDADTQQEAQNSAHASASSAANENRAGRAGHAAGAASTKQTLYIRYEKRNGKPATIVSEFQGSDDELKTLAKQLKSTLGVGGSAKDDEILLQGDVRAKLCAQLRSLGYRLKGEVK